MEGGSGRFWPRTIHLTLIALILLSTVAAVMVTIPAVALRWAPLIWAFDFAVCIIFAVEYGARLWVAPEHPPWRKLSAWAARRQWLLSWGAIIDLIAILPFYISALEGISLQAFISLRLFRFLKLGRYSIGLSSLADAIRQERHALIGCVVILCSLVLISASLMFGVESAVQPDKFGTIPQAMYWAMITLTTIGYGDVTPVTDLGKLIAAVTAVGSLFMLALPAGIIASAFSLEVHRRNFLVSWGMVADVPLFAELDVHQLDIIHRQMHSRIYEQGAVVVIKNDPCDFMYFIISGQLEVLIEDTPHYLREGDHFGEVTILEKTQWAYSVRAVTRSKLLMLKVEDLERLMETMPEIGERIRHAAQEKVDALEEFRTSKPQP